jgi:hypothetical protein
MVETQTDSFYIRLQHSQHKRGVVMFVLQVYVDLFLIKQNFDLANVTNVTWVVKSAAAPLILKVYIHPKIQYSIKHLFKVVWMQADLMICVVWRVPF